MASIVVTIRDYNSGEQLSEKAMKKLVEDALFSHGAHEDRAYKWKTRVSKKTVGAKKRRKAKTRRPKRAKRYRLDSPK